MKLRYNGIEIPLETRVNNHYTPRFALRNTQTYLTLERKRHPSRINQVIYMPNVAVNMRDSQWLLEYFREENVKVRDVLFGVIEALPSAGATAQ